MNNKPRKNNALKQSNSKKKSGHKSKRNKRKTEREKQNRIADYCVESANITQKRLTRKWGLYAAGKGSSSVFRGYQEEEHKAREEEDLCKIIKLAAVDRNCPAATKANSSTTLQIEDTNNLEEEADVPRTSTPVLSEHSSGSSAMPLKRARRQSVTITSSVSSINKSTSDFHDKSSRRSVSSLGEDDLSSCDSSPEQEAVMETTAFELESAFKKAFDSLFPNEEDNFSKSCHFLRSIHAHSFKINGSGKCDNLTYDQTAKPVLETEYGLSANPIVSVIEDAKEKDVYHFESDDVIFDAFAHHQQQSELFSCLSATQKPNNIFAFEKDDIWNTSDMSMPICPGMVSSELQTKKPRAFEPHTLSKLCEDFYPAETNDRSKDVMFTSDNKISSEPTILCQLNAPSQTQMLQIHQQMLLRLQDPNDKDILDYVDTVTFEKNSSNSRVLGHQVSPDRPLWPLKPISKVSRPSGTTTPRFFRHKLY